jgi:hypothetical protein
LLFGPKDFPALTIEMELEMEKVKVNVKEKGKPQTRGFFFFLFSFFFLYPIIQVWDRHGLAPSKTNTSVLGRQRNPISETGSQF